MVDKWVHRPGARNGSTRHKTHKTQGTREVRAAEQKLHRAQRTVQLPSFLSQAGPRLACFDCGIHSKKSLSLVHLQLASATIDQPWNLPRHRPAPTLLAIRYGRRVHQPAFPHLSTHGLLLFDLQHESPRISPTPSTTPQFLVELRIHCTRSLTPGRRLFLELLSRWPSSFYGRSLSTSRYLSLQIFSDPDFRIKAHSPTVDTPHSTPSTALGGEAGHRLRSFWMTIASNLSPQQYSALSAASPPTLRPPWRPSYGCPAHQIVVSWLDTRAYQQHW